MEQVRAVRRQNAKACEMRRWTTGVAAVRGRALAHGAGGAVVRRGAGRTGSMSISVGAAHTRRAAASVRGMVGVEVVVAAPRGRPPATRREARWAHRGRGRGRGKGRAWVHACERACAWRVQVPAGLSMRFCPGPPPARMRAHTHPCVANAAARVAAGRPCTYRRVASPPPHTRPGARVVVPPGGLLQHGAGVRAAPR